MTRLDNTEFLKQLSEVATKNNGKSSIYLTQKRLSNKDEILKQDSKIKDLPTNIIDSSDKDIINNNETYPILIRVSMNSENNKDSKNKKFKISTIIENDQINQFWLSYIQILKNGFIGLKKKEKKKSKKNKVSK
ncbi:uncharacterized protein KGF55_000949 [Candida pseudojiufengensis]|uniref:uncharacterized protein n=1 Tax=Candida pseudojiufengensis TaxID=497109 RepID=UPI00222507DF|nr:uncharacterized protein KGF55_000949 [Candida pseudojiufengensis]KAI5965587.1 hypothetical protein KGF55_000949 [Candida pseudojiufengensis]